MTKNLKWRLGKLPTVEELQTLAKDKIITNEEARNILFNEVNDEERDSESLKEEIKFLREMVSKLSSRTTIIETIKEIHQPYQKWDWYQPYHAWCSSASTGGTMYYSGTSANSTLTLSGSDSTISAGSTLNYDDSGSSFSQVGTF